MNNVPDIPHTRPETPDVASHFEHVTIERTDAADACAFYPRNDGGEALAGILAADDSVSFPSVTDPDENPFASVEAVSERSDRDSSEPIETGESSECDVTSAWLYATGDGFVDRLAMR